MTKGYLALVLHAHLPYVRHPEYRYSLEEKWYFEAVTETYLPLLAVFRRLQSDGIPFRITVSVSPTLAAMWEDSYLQEKYRDWLARLLDLADKEVVRTAKDPVFSPLARLYRQRFQQAYHEYFDLYHCNLAGVLRELAGSGHVELITSAATHGYLPLLNTQPEAVYAQLCIAVEEHTRIFGKPPRGIWLPECAYDYGIDEMLAELGINYFFLDTHGLLFAKPRPAYGTFSPLLTPAGVAAFGRDEETGKQVWSKTEGYPGDYFYRDFYRDIGFDLPLEYIGPYIHPDGIRVHTGFKYYRITGKTDHKEPYCPEKAQKKLAEHAGNFMFNRERQIEYARDQIGRPPIVVAPYDAELFGHWWYEGPAWLEDFFRKAHYDQDTFAVTTPSEYLQLGMPLQVAEPSSSSWGNGGYHEVWLNGKTHWTYPHLHMAAERMIRAADDFPAARGLQQQALNQLARELLLAQASDWPFIITTGTMSRYAGERVHDHLVRFNRLLEQVYSNRIDAEWLKKLQEKDNIFPQLDYRVFAPREKIIKIKAAL